MSETTGSTELPRINLERATEAPVLVFDEAALYGIMPGFGRLTLAVTVQDDDGAGGVKQRRVAIAHLRGNYAAFASLRAAINGMEEMLEAPPEGKLN